MRFEISRSINGGKLVFIARDTSGIVRLRKETEEELVAAINEYNEQAAKAKEAAAKARAKGKDKNTGSRVQGLDKGKTEDGEQSANDGIQKSEEASEPVQPVEPPQVEPPETVAETEPEGASKQKKFLQSGLKEQIEEKKRTSGKKSFWDKLK